MFNSQKPQIEDLPTGRQLFRATALAVVAAGAILVAVVLPSEYAVDPTGIGRQLGLTQMGEIKAQLAEEAAADAAAGAAPAAPVSQPAPAKVAAVASATRQASRREEDCCAALPAPRIALPCSPRNLRSAMCAGLSPIRSQGRSAPALAWTRHSARARRLRSSARSSQSGYGRRAIPTCSRTATTTCSPITRICAMVMPEARRAIPSLSMNSIGNGRIGSAREFRCLAGS